MFPSAGTYQSRALACSLCQPKSPTMWRKWFWPHTRCDPCYRLLLFCDKTMGCEGHLVKNRVTKIPSSRASAKHPLVPKQAARRAAKDATGAANIVSATHLLLSQAALSQRNAQVNLCWSERSAIAKLPSSQMISGLVKNMVQCISAHRVG